MKLGRSEPSKGELVNIIMMGTKKDHEDDLLKAYNKTVIISNEGEDYANTIWPVVIKVKKNVTDKQLIRHLRDLINCIEEKFEEEY